MDVLALQRWCLALGLDRADFVRRLERALREEEAAPS